MWALGSTRLFGGSRPLLPLCAAASPSMMLKRGLGQGPLALRLLLRRLLLRDSTSSRANRTHNRRRAVKMNATGWWLYFH
jgi:hypothetical protein